MGKIWIKKITIFIMLKRNKTIMKAKAKKECKLDDKF